MPESRLSHTVERNEYQWFPLQADRFGDFEQLFGQNGACGGCWCMWWKQTGSEFKASKGESNRRLIQMYVKTNKIPGILLYDGKTPIGWCAVEPRSHYSRLDRSRILKPVDEHPVWSITCFFIEKTRRKQGVMSRLIDAAIEYVRSQDGDIVEAYPIDPLKRTADAFIYTGIASTFRQAGFEEVARRSDTRPIMRYVV